jgi:hypothetical protein
MRGHDRHRHRRSPPPLGSTEPAHFICGPADPSSTVDFTPLHRSDCSPPTAPMPHDPPVPRRVALRRAVAAAATLLLRRAALRRSHALRAVASVAGVTVSVGAGATAPQPSQDDLSRRPGEQHPCEPGDVGGERGEFCRCEDVGVDEPLAGNTKVSLRQCFTHSVLTRSKEVGSRESASWDHFLLASRRSTHRSPPGPYQLFQAGASLHSPTFTNAYRPSPLGASPVGCKNRSSSPFLLTMTMDGVRNMSQRVHSSGSVTKSSRAQWVDGMGASRARWVALVCVSRYRGVRGSCLGPWLRRGQDPLSRVLVESRKSLEIQR